MNEPISVKRQLFELRERGDPVAVDLGEAIELGLSDALKDLSRQGIVRAAGSPNGIVIIEPAQFIGDFRAPRFTISIKPKSTGLFNALTQLAYEVPPARLVSEFTESEEGLAGITSLQRVFINLLTEEIHRGLKIEYHGERRVSSSPHGRLLFTDTLRYLRARGILHQVVCVEMRIHLDPRITCVFAKTLEILHRRGTIDPEESSKIGILRSIFGDSLGIEAETALQLAAELVKDGDLPQSSRRLIVIAVDILKNMQDIHISFRSAAGLSRFVNMERVWERVVAHLVQGPRDRDSVLTVLHPLRSVRTTLFPDGGPVLDPDAIRYLGQYPQLVVDAKYVISNAPVAGDVYQIFAYVARLNAGAGLIVYLSSGQTWREKIGTVGNGASIYSVGVSEDDLIKRTDILLGLFDNVIPTPLIETA